MGWSGSSWPHSQLGRPKWSWTWRCAVCAGKWERGLGLSCALCDGFEQAPEEVDLVVGNLPYERVALLPWLRSKFQHGLFGHANIYGVCTGLALRFACAGGVIANVTPTSFLADDYFKALRSLLGRETPPPSIGFIGKRKRVFADVL